MGSLPKSTNGSRQIGAEAEWIAIRVASALGENFLTMDDAAKRMILTDWVSDLERFPRHILEAAFTDHRRASTFPPKPAEIIKLASSRLSTEREAGGDARFLERRLADTRSWLSVHLTVGNHMVEWGPQIVPHLLREGYLPGRLWEAGFRTRQLSELVKAKEAV